MALLQKQVVADGLQTAKPSQIGQQVIGRNDHAAADGKQVLQAAEAGQRGVAADGQVSEHHVETGKPREARQFWVVKNENRTFGGGKLRQTVEAQQIGVCPNGDAVNDDFRPFFKSDFIKIENYDFKVFNRWGSLVFASQNLNDAWDGTLKGQACDTGIYIWTMTVRLMLNGKVQTKQLSGDVAIIR